MDFRRGDFVLNLLEKLFQKRLNCRICGRSTRKEKKFSGLVAGYSRSSCFQLFCCFWCDIASSTLLHLRQTFVLWLCITDLGFEHRSPFADIASRLLRTSNPRVTNPALILLKLRKVPKVRSAVLALFNHALSGYLFCSCSATSTCCCFCEALFQKICSSPWRSNPPKRCSESGRSERPRIS